VRRALGRELLERGVVILDRLVRRLEFERPHGWVLHQSGGGVSNLELRRSALVRCALRRESLAQRFWSASCPGCGKRAICAAMMLLVQSRRNPSKTGQKLLALEFKTGLAPFRLCEGLVFGKAR